MDGDKQTTDTSVGRGLAPAVYNTPNETRRLRTFSAGASPRPTVSSAIHQRFSNWNLAGTRLQANSAPSTLNFASEVFANFVRNIRATVKRWLSHPIRFDKLKFERVICWRWVQKTPSTTPWTASCQANCNTF